MRKVMTVAALAALGACSPAEDAGESATGSERVSAENEIAGITDRVTYQAVYPDGQTFVASYQGDGTIDSIGTDGTRYEGRYSLKSGKLCIDWPDDEFDDCYLPSPIETGNTATWLSDNSVDVNMTRLEYAEVPSQPEAN